MDYQKEDTRKRKFLKIFSVVLVIATISVVGFGYNRNKKEIQQNKAAAEQIKNQSVSGTETQSANNKTQYKYEGKKWLAIGDSITYKNQYQTQVAELCKIADVTTDAVSDQELGLMADRLTKESLSNIDLVTIFGGTYDYGSGKLLGLKEDDKTVDKFYGNIRKVIDKIQSLNPKIKIVFITPLKRGEYKNQPVYPAANQAGNTLEQYVQAIKYVCGQNSIQVIDLFNNSGIDESNLSEYTTDNLNLNTAGYKKISKVIADELENPK